MEFIIITGISGAGKTTALKTMEDLGYFCVDNLPISLIEKFAELTNTPDSHVRKVALGIDVRSGDFLQEMRDVLEKITNQGYRYRVVFLDAEDDTLIRRFKETRRVHPLAEGGRVEEGIAKEREMLRFLRAQADFYFDTTRFRTRELNDRLREIFVDEKEDRAIHILVLSFGYKYGIPKDADLVFDVRFLPNPFYDPALRPLTGEDAKIRDFVKQNGRADQFLAKLKDMLDFLLNEYVEEGRNQVVIAFGCTGGKHRSVTVAHEVYEMLSRKQMYDVRIQHVDIMK